MEATTGFEPVIKVLQTCALPLGYVAVRTIITYCKGYFKSKLKGADKLPLSLSITVASDII